MFDVVVVGAGPSGCKVAREVSKEGYDVLVIEEHSEIGIPTQCAGLVSFRIGRIPKRLILNRIKAANFCCRGKHFIIKTKKPMYVIDRRGYDNFLARLAEKAGVKIGLETKFLNFQEGKVITSNGNYSTKILVGADGPNSSVARVAGIKLPKNLLKAIQARVKSSFNADIVELWFGSEIAAGNFAWVVPENEEVARVGLMVRDDPSLYFERFLKKRLEEIKILDKIGDIIRYGLIEKSVADNVLLVGDAACQVKPFSLGGLIYGKIGAEIASNACVKALEENDFSKRFLIKNYDRLWKEKLGLSIKKGMVIKKLFSFFQNSPTFFELMKIFGSIGASFLDVDFL